MPNYIKRGIWLHGVASHLENRTAAHLLHGYADQMIDRAEVDRSTPPPGISASTNTGECHEYPLR